MLKETLQSLLNLAGLSLHKKSSIDRLLRENEEYHRRMGGFGSLGVPPIAEQLDEASLEQECQRLRAELKKHEDRQIFYQTTEDYHAHDKMRRIVDRIPVFGEADFADLSCWLFAASLNNHRVVHQRIDEGSLLWRAVKMSGGPILEVGRAAGGSTLILLGASGQRPVVSIDRAPFHAFIAEQAFARPDVARRLKLYVQTSREPITEREFGMLFIDADHSYEGICHDIGAFWNSLKSFDGKPALAAFHDGADNPITFVEPVKHACEELLAEPGAARIVESWGSMLVLEKTGDIDQDRWFKKEHVGFWEQFADAAHPMLRPAVLRGRLRPERPAATVGTFNLLGDHNVEHESWIKHGVTIERLQLNEDNPVRLLRETTQSGDHRIEKPVAVNLSRFQFSVYLRPHRLKALRLSVLNGARTPLAEVDFELGDRSRIGRATAKDNVEISDAAFLYRNGYFGCDLAVALPAPISSAVFAISLLDPAGTTATYRGDGQRGFFINLSSVREILEVQ